MAYCHREYDSDEYGEGSWINSHKSQKENKDTYRTEFFKGDFPVAIRVGVDNGFVDYLLQLCVFQVAANHHLEHLEQLTVRDVAIFVHVVDFEGNCKMKELIVNILFWNCQQ